MTTNGWYSKKDGPAISDTEIIMRRARYVRFEQQWKDRIGRANFRLSDELNRKLVAVAAIIGALMLMPVAASAQDSGFQILPDGQIVSWDQNGGYTSGPDGTASWDTQGGYDSGPDGSFGSWSGPIDPIVPSPPLPYAPAPSWIVPDGLPQLP